MIEPYYDHAGITIYHGDCRELLPTLKSTDAIISEGGKMGRETN
jgi:hypothetical protein